MVCLNCKKTISDNAKFCPFCGKSTTPQKSMHICPSCGWTTEENLFYCMECGTLLENSTDFVPPVSDAVQQAASNSKTYFIEDKREYRLWSFYDGRPAIGIAKATGNLRVYTDRIEMENKLGNAIGGAFGLIGLTVAAKAARKEPVDTIWFRDIRNVEIGKYCGVYNTLYVESLGHIPITLVPPVPGSLEPQLIADYIRKQIHDS